MLIRGMSVTIWYYDERTSYDGVPRFHINFVKDGYWITEIREELTASTMEDAINKGEERLRKWSQE